MKHLLLMIGFCVVAFTATAQCQTSGYTKVRLFELESGIGANIGSSKIGDSKTPHMGLYLFLEPRVNITNSPLDIGIQVLIGASGNTDYDYHTTLQYRPAFVTFVDYNMRKWRKISLFGGLGIGMSAVNFTYPEFDEFDGKVKNRIFTDRSFVLNPRIGAEFFNHLRLTFEYKWMKKEYSYFGISIGGVFGGGLKK